MIIWKQSHHHLIRISPLLDVIPVIKSSPSKTNEVVEGQAFEMTVEIADAMSVIWLFNGNEVGDGYEVKSNEMNHTLRIPKMKPELDGVYTVEIISPSGQVLKEDYEVKCKGILLNFAPFNLFTNTL